MATQSSTLNSLFRSAAIFKGEKILFTDEEGECSGNEALDTVHSLAGGLQEFGIRQNSKLAFLCDNSIRYILSFLACQHLGAITCALHVRSTSANIATSLRWLEAEVLVFDRKYEQLVKEAVDSADITISLIVFDENDKTSTVNNYNTLLSFGKKVEEAAPPHIDAPAMIILSSGTTGEPKGIVHSQSTLYESAMAGKSVFGEINDDDSVIVAMAPSFAAWNHVVFPYLAFKANIVFNRVFDADHYVKSIISLNVTHAALVPTAWRRVLSAIEVPGDLASLRLVFFAGEAGTPEFIRDIKEKISGAAIRSGYLTSEGGDASACVADTDLLMKDKISIGKPVPGAGVRIVEPEGSIDDELKQGETGEIVVSGPSLALGYWKNKTLSKQRFINGWWRSGDLGYIDEQGNLNIAGRNDNMIITGGLKVHAEEIEAALMQHPAVSLAAVIAKPDEEWGQSIEAFVVGDSAIDVDTIIQYCRERELLPSFKLPKKIHVRDSLPTGATGKIYRRALLELDS